MRPTPASAARVCDTAGRPATSTYCFGRVAPARTPLPAQGTSACRRAGGVEADAIETVGAGRKWRQKHKLPAVTGAGPVVRRTIAGMTTLSALDVSRALAALATAVAVAACGGGSGEPAAAAPVVPPTTYAVAGVVSGATGAIVLQLNAGNDLGVPADGAFAFSGRVASGSAWAVTVRTQPPGQVCSVAGGSGASIAADVGTVQVGCVNLPPDTFRIAGSVAGLAGSGLVLRNSDGSLLPVAGNGGFAFPVALPNGSAWAVTVSAQPRMPTQACTVANGSGTLAGANVGNVAVTCTTSSYSVGGVVSGLSGTLQLALNGASPLTLTANGAFTFAAPVADGLGYAVTVLAQPSGQACTVAQGSGTVMAGNVVGVTIACVAGAARYSIGGMASGLSGSGLVLRNNGGDALAVGASGSFVFATPLPSGSAYAVTVAASPAGQTCLVANASGTVATANVTGVAVTCTTPPPPAGTSAEGAWLPIIVAGGTYTTYSMVVLENGRYWIFYSATAAGRGVVPFLRGTSVSAAGRFTSSDLTHYPVSGAATGPGSIVGTYVPGASFSSTLTFNGISAGFSGYPQAATRYDYQARPDLARFVGAWAATALDGSSQALTIAADGSFSSTAAGCTSTGTLVPRASGKNVFDFTLRRGATCPAAGSTFTGIALLSQLASGTQTLNAAGVSADAATGTSLTGQR